MSVLYLGTPFVPPRVYYAFTNIQVFSHIRLTRMPVWDYPTGMATETLTLIPNYAPALVWDGMYDGAQAESDWLSQEDDYFDPDLWFAAA